MLSKRLKAISDMVNKNTIIADIGTDHGYIPVYLLENNIIKRAIASDISQGSLNKIIEYTKRKNLEKYIDSRLGDGLEILKPFEVDTVIIAGMGGILIRDILDKNRNLTNTFSEFILQAMTAIPQLRRYLYENGFKILENKILKEDGHFYQIIRAEIGKDSYEDEIDLEIPKDLYNYPITLEYLNREIRIRKEIINNLENIDTEKVKERLKTVTNELEKYRKVVAEIEAKRN